MSIAKPDREINYDEKGAVKLNQTVDEIVKENAAYQYLCHVEEVRNWFKKMNPDVFQISDDTSIIDFENSLRNGVILAKLACITFPKSFKEDRIFDRNLEIFNSKGLVFRHIDNINTFYRLMDEAELPQVFFPVTTDIYDRKNMPKLIYSIHALAILLHRKGLIKVKIGDVFGKIQFNQEELSQIQQEFDRLNISMPQFGKIGGILAKEVKRDDAKRFACIVKINEAIEKKNAEELFVNLSDPICELENVDEDVKDGYLTLLSMARNRKIEENQQIIDNTPIEELDYFVKNLTFDEIQEIIIKGNVNNVLHNLDVAITKKDIESMVKYLRDPILNLNQNIFPDYLKFYMKRLRHAHNVVTNDNTKFYNQYALDEADVEKAVKLSNEDIENTIRLNNALKTLQDAIESNHRDKLKEALSSEALKLENVKHENLDAYMQRFRQEEDMLMQVDNIQNKLNEVNGAMDTDSKIKKILTSIEKYANQRNYEKISKHLSSNLLKLKFDKDNIPLYCENIAETLKIDDSKDSKTKIGQIQSMLEDSDRQTSDAKKLAQLTIDLENCAVDRKVVEYYLESDLVSIDDVKKDNYEEYEKHLIRKMSNTNQNSSSTSSSLSNDAGQDNESKFKCIAKDGKEFYYDEDTSTILWKFDASKNNVYENLEKTCRNRKRLTMPQMAAIVKKCNEYLQITGKTEKITKIQEIIKMLLQYHKYQERFKRISSHPEEIVRVQNFFRNIVGRNDFHNLMRGAQVALPVIVKFINILIPNDYDLQKMLQLSEMKSDVRDLIIKIQEKEARVKDLELLCGLLVQSKYSDRSSKAIPESVTSGYLRQERIETLKFYGKLLYCLIMYVKYFAKLLYTLDINEQYDISSTVLPIFDYISTPSEEIRALRCIMIALDMYVADQSCLQLITHGNPNPFKLAQECAIYFKKDQYLAFLNCFRPTVNDLIEKGVESYSINPLHIYVDMKKTDAVLDITVEKVLKDPMIVQKLSVDISVIIDFVQSVMNALKESVPHMPYMFRAIIKHIYVGDAFVANLDEKYRLQCVANLLLSKILYQILTIPEQHGLSDKQPSEIKEKQRKLMTQVANIVVAIGMKQKFKGAHLSVLDKFVFKQHSAYVSIIEEIIDIPPITDNYQVSKRSEFIDDSDSVTLRIEKLISLHDLLLKYKDQIVDTGDDLLRTLLESSEEPKIENFLKDPDVNAITKKEMSRKLVTIELVRQVKPLSAKKETSKHLMKNLKILFCQLLFAIDKDTFSPTRVTEVLEHKWTKLENESHERNNKYFKGISSARNHGSAASIFSSENLTQIQIKCVELVNKLNQQEFFNKDADYQELVDEIAADIRSEHSRKIEMRQQISLLTISKKKLLETDEYLDKKITFLDSYAASLKKNLSKNTKKNKRFSKIGAGHGGYSGGSSKAKNKSYAADKLMKKKIIVNFNHPDVNNIKDVQIKFTEANESNFQVSLMVIGSTVEETTVDSSDVILKTYNKQLRFELFKGVEFDTRELYKLLVNK